MSHHNLKIKKIYFNIFKIMAVAKLKFYFRDQN